MEPMPFRACRDLAAGGSFTSLDGSTDLFLFQAGDEVRDEVGGGHGLLDEVEVVVVSCKQDACEEI